MNRSATLRWSLWHSVIGLVVVAGAVVGSWAIAARPPHPTGPTTVERRAQRLDEVCRMIDTEIQIADKSSPSARPALEVLGRLAVVCHGEFR
jgi:hypothetical protein